MKIDGTSIKSSKCTPIVHDAPTQLVCSLVKFAGTELTNRFGLRYDAPCIHSALLVHDKCDSADRSGYSHNVAMASVFGFSQKALLNILNLPVVQFK